MSHLFRQTSSPRPLRLPSLVPERSRRRRTLCSLGRPAPTLPSLPPRASNQTTLTLRTLSIIASVSLAYSSSPTGSRSHLVCRLIIGRRRTAQNDKDLASRSSWAIGSTPTHLWEDRAQMGTRSAGGGGLASSSGVEGTARAGSDVCTDRCTPGQRRSRCLRSCRCCTSSMTTRS